MTTDKQIKASLQQVWTDAATGLSESVRVIPYWKLSLKGREVLSALRALDNNKAINGVYITRVKRTSRKVGKNHFEYKWVYAMFYFRSYSDGGSSVDTSEDKMNAYLEAVAQGFELNPGLGFDDVDNHEELQIHNIDTIDLKVHVAQCLITVNLTNQPH